MTERLRSGSCANSAKTAMGGPDLSPKKTMVVLVIVVGCFAVLWPKVFYPMLAGSAQNHIKPSAIDRTTGCCDVISEIDVNTIKLMSELCSTIINKNENDPTLTAREIVVQCRKAVLETCGIDISAVLQEQVRLGQTTKQILNEIRSLNGSLCLKYNFGVSPSKLGVPHRITFKVAPSNVKQERPLQLRSEMVHPAFRERGRAIPQTDSSSPSRPPPKIVEGRPGPIPGMRPTIGGAGHVVAAKQSSTGTMGLIMPVYTIGIVIFFTYTVMKIMFRKQPEALYPPVDPDPVFRREVFEANRGHLDPKLSRIPSSKLVVNAMSALLDEVDQELAARRKASAGTEQDVMANGKVHHQDDQASVKVMGMEMTASCEGNKKWSRPDSPVLPTPYTVQPQQKEPSEPPQEIYLEGALPPQSNHLLVADSATEAQKVTSEEDPAVVLAGKMTLSVISLDSSENGTDESSGRKPENERSSSNVSEDFEKIELEDQINDIIQEAENITSNRNILEDLNIDDMGTLDIQTFESPEQVENINQDILDEIRKELGNIEKQSDVLEIKEYPSEKTAKDVIETNIDNESKISDEIIEALEKSSDPILDIQESVKDNETPIDNTSLKSNISEFLLADLKENTPIISDSQVVQIKENPELIEETLIANVDVDSVSKEVLQPTATTIEESVTKDQIGENIQPNETLEKLNTNNDLKEVVDEFIHKEITTSEHPVGSIEQKQSEEIIAQEISQSSDDIIKETTASEHPVKSNDEKQSEEIIAQEISQSSDDILKETTASEHSVKSSDKTQSEEILIQEITQSSADILKDIEPSKEVVEHKDKVESKIDNLPSETSQEVIKDIDKPLTDNNTIIESSGLEKVDETEQSEKIIEAIDPKIDHSSSDLQQKPDTQIAEKLDAKTEIIPEHIESTEDKDIKKIFDDLNAAVLGLSTELNPSRLGNVPVDVKVEENIPQSSSTLDENIDLNEPEDEDDVEYEYEYEEEEDSDGEHIDDEIRDIDRIDDSANRAETSTINGNHHGTSSNATLAERDISDEENLMNENNDDEDEIIQEIIEYISDEEEEEEVEEDELEPNSVNHINNDTESANH